MKSTPGPWKVYHEYNVTKGNRSIANCGGHTVNTENWQEVDEENKANARLIASAPALLALLTEPIQNYHTISLDFATDLECDADIIKEAGFKVRAAGLRAKAQAIRAALAAARGELG